MVDINTTRAVSKKLKATTSQRGNPGQIPTDETAPIPEGVNTAIIPDEEDLSGEGGDNFIEFIEVVKPDTVRPPDEKTRILNSAIEAQAKGDDLLAGILLTL
ncbi:hypothetical protein KEM48_000910 [Puccinia striiformis f. sp. tritici PST-130]|nr:hypothetical protein KEM48_000910 [Puccinia striiformis f. sp. tritici PST-130]